MGGREEREDGVGVEVRDGRVGSGKENVNVIEIGIETGGDMTNVSEDGHLVEIEIGADDKFIVSVIVVVRYPTCTYSFDTYRSVITRGSFALYSNSLLS